MEALPYDSIDFSESATEIMNNMPIEQYDAVMKFIAEFFIGVTDLYGDQKLTIFDEDSRRAVRGFFDGQGGAALLLLNSVLSLELRRRPEWGLRVTRVTFATRH